MNNRVKTNETQEDAIFTVGVLIDSVDSFFNHRAITDLISAAEDQNLHLVFFFGGSLNRNSTAGPYSYAYTLPNAEIIQALIIFPHLISPFSPQEGVKQLLTQYPKVPVYSIFGNLPNYYSIIPNEKAAIETMLQHLVEDHSYTKIALLCGTDSPESTSRERQNTILNILHSYNLEIDDSLQFPGSFSAEDGRVTAKKILSRNGNYPEVLICMNDQMAIGAVKEFQNNGVSVPEDIAVVGFDDVGENSSLPCTFTTINFPVWEIISLVMERISTDLTGKTQYTNEKIERQAQFMHRESCGCTSYFEQKLQTNTSFTPQEQQRSSLSTLKKAAILRRSLEDIVEDCILNKEATLFTEFIHQAIHSLSRSGDLTNSFIDTFSTQWTITLLHHQDFESQVFINALFVDAFRLLIQIKMKALSRIHLNDMGSLTFYQNCNALLTQKISMYEAINGIGSYLPPLGISRCLFVFISPENPTIGELRLSYKEGFFTEFYETDCPRFPITQLINTSLESIPFHLAILPIAHNNTVYGYIVFSLSDKHFEQFNMIQLLVSHIIDSAVTNDLLSTHIQALTKKNDVLSKLSVIDEFTGLYNRRALYVTGRNMYQQTIDNRETSCVIFVDMDGLKKINDTFGHKDGDIAILALSTSLKKSFRENDLVVRYGGDEFVILMTNIPESVVQKALDRIETEITNFNIQKSTSWTLSASWGYVYNKASSTPKSFETLIEESDAKLYEEKRRKKTSL